MDLFSSGLSRFAAGILFTVLAATAFVGCGSGDDPEGERVSTVIAEALMTEDAEYRCKELVSESFVDAVYGSLDDCIAAGRPDGDDGALPDEVRVAEIEIEGETATAEVTEVGGETDGATGTFTLVEVDDEWRIDELGIDYLRSQLVRGMAGMGDSDAAADENNPLSDPAVRDCIGEGLEGLDDEKFRQIAYDGMADREPSDTFFEVVMGCVPELASQDNG